MNCAIGMVALLVVQCTPALPRTLRDAPPAAGDEPNSVHGTPDEPSLPVLIRHRRHSVAGREGRHKVKVEPDGSLWAQLPPSERLVEIVPIDHSNDNSAGRALAYILPSAGDTARKQNRAPGLVIGDVVPNSSEQLTSSYDTWESESSDSSGSDNDATEEDIVRLGHQSNGHRTSGVKIERYPKEHVAYVNDDNADSEGKFNSKLNDIVSYFKEHKDVDLNSLIHDVLPSDELDPEYHVHYIIHKNHRPKDDRVSDEANSHDYGSNIIHAKNKPSENEVKQEEIHVHPQRPAPHHHETKNERENHHYHTTRSDAIGHPNIHSIRESNSDPIHNTILSNDELLLGDAQSTSVDKLTHHAPMRESLELVPPTGVKNIIRMESIEQLHGGLHVGAGEPGFDQRYDKFAENDKSSDTDTRTNHPNHVYTISDVPISNSSDYSDSNSDESSSEHYSDSFDDDISDEEADKSKSTAVSASRGETLESEESSQAEDVSETLVYHADRGDGGQTAAGSDSGDDGQATVGSDPAIGATSSSFSGVPSASSPPQFSFSDCLKQKKEAANECGGTCERRNSYTLTFSFNR